MLNSQYVPQFSRFFSNATIKELAISGNSTFVSSILKDSGYLQTLVDPSITFAELFDDVFRLLVDEYRCEYVYKNVIASQLLLDQHSLNNSSLLSELRVGQAKADLVMLNGNSTAYEIKTELDNLERLHDQLLEYRKMFDQLFVVAPPPQMTKIEEVVDEDIGLAVLTDTLEIQIVREADSNRSNVSPEVIFDSLRRVEYCQIIEQEFGYVPNVPNTMIYRECLKLFRTLSPETAHDRMVDVLRARNHDKGIDNLIYNLPKSLRMVGLENRLSQREWRGFQDLLSKRV